MIEVISNSIKMHRRHLELSGRDQYIFSEDDHVLFKTNTPFMKKLYDGATLCMFTSIQGDHWVAYQDSGEVFLQRRHLDSPEAVVLMEDLMELYHS